MTKVDNWKETLEFTAAKVAPMVFPHKQFVMDKGLERLYYDLWMYFKGDKGFERDGRSLDKGLLLTGNVGCGKTIAMHVFKSLSAGGDRSFGFIETSHVVRMVNDEGLGVIDRYGRSSFVSNQGILDRKSPLRFCFDDLGLESTVSKVYGNSTNVMADILLDRYSMWVQHGMITHATTNLDPDSIEKVYGHRVRNRIKEMMNLIVVEGGSLR